MSLRTVPEMSKVSELHLNTGHVFAVPGFQFPFSPIVFEKHDAPLTSEEEEQRAIAKIKMLGNIKFIGELGKLNLIHESILHKCIKTVSWFE